MPARNRFAAISGLVVVAGGLFASCREPTAIDLQITTDALCNDVRGTTVTVGELGAIETKDPVTSTRACDDDTHRIGSLVVVPSGEHDGPVAIRVVTGIGQSPENCVKSGYKGGCIVARRALRYVPSTTLTLPIEMTIDCLDFPCDVTETCVHGKCVPAEIPDPENCNLPGGCTPWDGGGGKDSGPDATSEDAIPDADAFTDPPTDEKKPEPQPETGPDVLDAKPDQDAAEVGPDADSAVVPDVVNEDAGQMDAAEEEAAVQDATQEDAQEEDAAEEDASEEDGAEDAADAEAEPPIDAPDDAIVCQAGFGNCDGNDANGCEAALTSDPLNCGECARDCLGTACNAGACAPTVIASTGLQNPTGLAVDFNFAYVTNFVQSGYISRFPLDGSAAPTSIVTGYTTPFWIGADFAEMFWTWGKGNGGLTKALKDGTGPADIGPGQNAYGLTLSATEVFWCNQFGSVWKVNKDGTGLMELANSQTKPSFIALDPGNAFFTTLGTNNNGRANVVPRGGGPVWYLAIDEVNPMGIAADDSAVFWVTRGAGNSYTDGLLRKHANQVMYTLATGIQDGFAVALDADWVYWTSRGDGLLERMRRDGTRRMVLISGLVQPGAIALDASYVYVTSSGDGQVVKVAR